MTVKYDLTIVNILCDKNFIFNKFEVLKTALKDIYNDLQRKNGKIGKSSCRMTLRTYGSQVCVWRNVFKRIEAPIEVQKL